MLCPYRDCALCLCAVSVCCVRTMAVCCVCAVTVCVTCQMLRADWRTFSALLRPNLGFRATHVLAGLIMPDRLESGSTARVVSLLQRAGYGDFEISPFSHGFLPITAPHAPCAVPRPIGC